MRRADRLSIHGPHQTVAELLRALESTLAAGWSRNHDQEARMHQMWNTPRERVFCFTCPDGDGYPPSNVWVEPGVNQSWTVVNILPLRDKPPFLSVDEYNAVLRAFQKQIDAVARAFTGVHTSIEPFEFRPEDYLSATSAEILRRFTRPANKEITQQSDRRLWMEFIKRTHKIDTSADIEFLQEWFEHQGWPETRIEELIQDFERSRELLTIFEEKE